MTSREATEFPPPCHNQSRTPPTSLTGADKSLGAACNRLIVSRKFDLPEPFGPIRIFSFESATASALGPNESRLLILMLLSNILLAFSVSETTFYDQTLR